MPDKLQDKRQNNFRYICASVRVALKLLTGDAQKFPNLANSAPSSFLRQAVILIASRVW